MTDSEMRLHRENSELRQRIGQLGGALERCRKANAPLKRERRKLRAEVRELRRSPWVLLPWKGYVS